MATLQNSAILLTERRIKSSLQRELDLFRMSLRDCAIARAVPRLRRQLPLLAGLHLLQQVAEKLAHAGKVAQGILAFLHHVLDPLIKIVGFPEFTE